MRILLSWLRDFVEIQESPRDLAHALTMAGMAVDTVEEADGDTLFEFDITSNRPDAMNHFGMAREVASIYRRPLRRPTSEFAEADILASSMASVEIANPESCARYVGRVFTGVRVGPSPDWIRRRIELCGIRPINNLADLTNYALLEMGQPTHAFDLDKLAGRHIEVRTARPGESLVTLDGVLRELVVEDLVICDAEKPVALAGVMGGEATEITAETQNVLLEAAWFKPSTVRNTSRRLKLFSEASHRFERGADWDGTVWAAGRIASLLGQTGPGAVLKGCIDCYPGSRDLPEIRLQSESIRRHLGVDLGGSEVESILLALGFRPVASDNGWIVPAASHRLDVEREIDLIEEIARIHGFEKIPATLPAVGIAPARTPKAAEDTRMRNAVSGLGYDETIGFSFSSSSESQRFGGSPEIALRNPISKLWDVMRTSAVPTMLRALEWNLKRNQPFVRLAEFGRVYQRTDAGFVEPKMLCLGASGTARPLCWSEPSRPFGFFELKADVAALLHPFDSAGLRFDSRNVPPYYRQGHAASARCDAGVLAHFGEIDPEITREQKIRQPVWVAEVFLDEVYQRGLRAPAHRRLARVPAVSRDFSLLVPESVAFERIIDTVGPMADLISLEPLEVFRGQNVPRGHYSLLLRASWQRLDESLTDEEVNSFAAELRSGLHARLGIVVRT